MKLTKGFKESAILALLLIAGISSAMLVNPNTVWVCATVSICVLIKLAVDCIDYDERRSHDVVAQAPINDAVHSEIQRQVKAVLYTKSSK